MSGHSHWATIKRKKGAADAKKGKQFSKIAKSIMSAVKQGGPIPDTNLKLQYAIQEARNISMPRDTIENAIKKASGEKGGTDFTEAIYEGFGPGGVGIIITTLTDNTNRTGPEVRKILERKGGKMAGQGSVSHKFETVGMITVSLESIEEDALLDIAVEAGADDVTSNKEDNVFEIISPVSDFSSIIKALEEKEIKIDMAEITMITQLQTDVDEDTSKKLIVLMEELDEHDDVQKVYTDANFPA